MRSSIGIDVRAPAPRVLELARDLANWPHLLPHYRSARLTPAADGRVLASLVAVRPLADSPRFGIPVAWRAEQWAEDADPTDLRLRFRHLRGVTSGMDVTWHIRPTADGCRVTIEHDFRRPLPLLGDRLLPRIVDRYFTRPIAGRTLRRFKQLAETAP
jgi:ribosome-associated toxin RatA of RatAB toxin-antitoxin module